MCICNYICTYVYNSTEESAGFVQFGSDQKKLSVDNPSFKVMTELTLRLVIKEKLGMSSQPHDTNSRRSALKSFDIVHLVARCRVRFCFLNFYLLLNLDHLLIVVEEQHE